MARQAAVVLLLPAQRRQECFKQIMLFRPRQFPCRLSYAGFFGWIALAVALTAVVTPAQAQDRPAYMHVTEWQIPHAQWLLWEAFEESTYKPLLEKMLADGKLLDWGLYTNVLHSPNGPTHGLWFSAAGMTDIQSVLEAEMHLPPNSVMDNPAVKQRDLLFREIARGGRNSQGTAILWVHRTQSAAAKSEQIPAFWDKYLKPMLEALLAQGTLISYGMETEQIRTQPAGAFYIHCLLPDAGAADKFFSALDGMQSRMTAPERDEFNAVQVTEDHERLGRVTSFGLAGAARKK